MAILEKVNAESSAISKCGSKGVENANSRHGDFYRGIGKQRFPQVLVVGAPLKGMPAQGHKLSGRVTPPSLFRMLLAASTMVEIR